MTSVAPFQSMHITPGDNSTDEARDRWKDKTVDELRTANNRKAKISEGTVEGEPAIDLHL
jgi:hypothetical protein